MAIREVIMRTTAAKPYRDREGKLQTERYLAGNRYMIDDRETPEVAQWLTNYNCYPANESEPGVPPVIPPFISSKQPDSDKRDDQIKDAVERGIIAAFKAIAADGSLLERLRKTILGGKSGA